MFRKRASKGFTIIELLAAIVILALLVATALYANVQIQEEARKKYYSSQEKLIVLAGKDYFADYRSYLPKENGESARVLLKTLVNEKYIEKVVDHKDNICYYEESYVGVQKIGDKEYSYYTYLKCPNYDSNQDNKAPVITFTPNSKKTNQSLQVVMRVKDDRKVDKVRYVLKQGDQVIKDTGYTYYRGDQKIDIQIDGTYQIIGYAIDDLGLPAERKSGKYILDRTPPDCSKVKVTSTFPEKKWSSTKVTLDLSFSGVDGSYWEWYTKEESGTYQKQKTNEMHVLTAVFSQNGKYKGKIVVYDEVGNSCEVETGQYYIDKTKATVSLEGSVANNKVTKGAVLLTATPSPTSAPSSYTYTFQKLVNGEYKDVVTSTSKTYRVTDEGKNTWRVLLTVGNGNTAYSNTWQTNIDNTPPDCSTIQINATQPTFSWTENDISITITPNNTDILNWDYLQQKDGGTFSTIAYNQKGERTKELTSTGKYTIRVVAYDEAGNSCQKEDGEYYIDKTNPSVRLSGSITSGQVTSNSVLLTAAPSPTSAPSLYTYTFQKLVNGVYKDVVTSSSKTYRVYEEGKNTWRVLLTAGNGKTAYSNTWQTNIDTTPPNCNTVQITSSYPTNTWTRTNISLTINPNNTDIDSWDLLQSNYGSSYSTVAYNQRGQVTKTLSSSGRYDMKVRAYDAAGNSCEKTSGTYLIDKVYPNVTISGSVASGSETASNVTLTSSVYPYPESEVLSYQWQRKVNGSWQNVSYATSSSYTASGVQYNEYRLQVITGIGETLYSNTWTVHIIDLTPYCDMVTITVSAPLNTWTNEDITVSMYIPAGSNIERWEWYTNNNGGSWNLINTYWDSSKTLTWSGSSASGIRRGKLIGYSASGQSCEVTTGSYYLDQTKPTVPTSVVRVNNSSGTKFTSASSSSYWTNKTLWWGSFSSTDNDSGIDHYEYSAGCTGSKTNNLASSYTYSSNKNNSYCIRAVDRVGNVSNWSSAYYFRIDKTPPSVTVQAYKRNSSGTKTGSAICSASTSGNTSVSLSNCANLVNNWYNKANYPSGVYYEFTSTDGTSGIASKTWKWNQAGQNGSNSNIWPSENEGLGKDSHSLSGEGYRKARYIVTDKAGNTATINITAPLDRTPPKMTDWSITRNFTCSKGTFCYGLRSSCQKAISYVMEDPISAFNENKKRTVTWDCADGKCKSTAGASVPSYQDQLCAVSSGTVSWTFYDAAGNETSGSKAF